MKKLLFASTALVASTGFAAAQSVDVSGTAEMGIFGGDDIDTQFHTDIDVIFSMAGETDSGLTFGADIDLDEQIGDNNAITGGPESGATRDDSDDGGAVIFVSGSLGTLTMGDTDGAFDFALTEADIGSSLNDVQEHAGWSGNDPLDGFYDGQIARYDYSFGDFSVAVSAEIDDAADEDFDVDFDGDLTDELQDQIDLRAQEIDNDTVLGIGANYAGSFGMFDFGVGLGYQRAGMENITVNLDNEPGDRVDTEGMDLEAYGISADFSMDNGISAVLSYTGYDGFEVDDAVQLDRHYGVAIGYEFGEFLVAANYGEYSLDGADDISGYSVLANYDLGGGAQLQGGYGKSDLSDEVDFDTFSLGIAMAF